MQPFSGHENTLLSGSGKFESPLSIFSFELGCEIFRLDFIAENEI